MSAGIHHLELWVEDLARAEPGWAWPFDSLGWREFRRWPAGVSWRHEDGSYVVVEQSSDVRREPHDRLRPGLNHLALTCPDRAALDGLRQDAAAHGWVELFADLYPHAGGPEHTALFLEDAQGFEVEVVAVDR